MKQLMVVAAIFALATTGCANNGLLSGRKCSNGACHVTRSQMAPRPEIIRTACRDGGCLLGQGGGGCCDCGDGCNCCDPGCGYCECCPDGCCANGQGCFGGNGRGGCFGNGGRNGCYGNGCGRCQGCLSGECCLCPHSGGYPEPQNFNPSPPVGQVAYPYYTVRGPRDFLQSNPPSIGPN